MKKVVIKCSVILALWCAGPALGMAEKVADLSQIDKPQGIAIDKHQLYITQQATVFIFSLKDYQLTKKFGRKGQGPREFAVRPYRPLQIDVSTDVIIVNSLGKISYFTKQGEFLREVRAKSLALTLRPFEEGFIGWSQATDRGIIYATINIYDGRLNRLKEIYRMPDAFQGPGKGYHILHQVFVYQALGKNILIPGRDDASLRIISKDLKELVTLRVRQKRRRVSQDFKGKMIRFIRDSPETKEVYPRIKPLIFPAYYPVIQNFFVDNDLIYIQTWKSGAEGDEFHIFNLNGQLVKKINLPIRYETDLKAFPILIQDGTLYQLVENGTTEVWEFHRSRI